MKGRKGGGKAGRQDEATQFFALFLASAFFLFLLTAVHILQSKVAKHSTVGSSRGHLAGIEERIHDWLLVTKKLVGTGEKGEKGRRRAKMRYWR